MNVLMVHGVNVNEDANPYVPWAQAIVAGLNNASYVGPVVSDPKSNGVRYNALFDKYYDDLNDDWELYLEAVGKILACWAWDTVFGPSPRSQFFRGEQP